MKYFSVLILLVSTAAQASTFVGNGGNAGDVELSVALQQIQGTLRSVEEKSHASELCQCSAQFQNHSICQSLEPLNSSQVLFCGEVLKKKSGELAALLEGDQVQFVWTHQKISVQEEPHHRAADAVTDPSARVVTINQNRFLKMSPSDRVFLLTHEIFHLTDWEGKRLTDTGPIGPFTGGEGERQLLNSMAAATVVKADHFGYFERYAPALNRPKAWKKQWVDVYVTGSRYFKETDNPYELNDFGGWGLAYRHYWSSWGATIVLRKEKVEHELLSSIGVNEERQLLGAGLSYRLFPFRNPLSYWGQSHLVSQAILEYLSSEHRLQDHFVGTTSKKTTVGTSLELKYYIPLPKNIWFFGGIAMRYHPLKHPTVGVNYKSPSHSSTIGVSYGF